MSIYNEGFWEWDLISDRLYLSAFCREFTGCNSDGAVNGTSFLKALIYPDDQQEFFDAVRYPSNSTSDVSSISIRLLTRSGDIQCAECSSSILGYDENGNAARIVGRLVIPAKPGKTELELHNLNRALLAISSCNHALLRAGNEVELLNDICRIVVEIGGYRMAWVGYSQNDPEKSVHPVARYGYDEGYVDKLGITWADVDRGRGPTGTAIRTGEPNAVCNFQSAPGLVSRWKKEAAKRGYISILGLPLKTEQIVFGALTIYSGVESAFNDEEVELLSSLADNLSYGITMLRNRNAKNDAEAAMRQSEARYRSLFENHYTVMLIIDPQDGSIIDANPAAMDYYGWSREELCDMNIKQINILPDEDVQAEMGLASQRTCNLFFFRHRLADGTIRDVEVNSGPIAANGKTVLYSIVNDVTERKHFKELADQRYERMHYILTATNAALWETGLTTEATIWSQEIWDLYGLTPGSCVPSFENWMQTVIPEDREAMREAAYKAMANKSEFNGLWRVRKSDDAIRWLMAKGTPFIDQDGSIESFVGIVIDVTDRKKEEEQKHQLETQLLKTQRLETIGTFAGGIAHDFNNILTPILGYAEMGMLKLQAENPLHKFFTEIMLSAERAQHLVSQILTFVKAQKTERSIVSIQSIIDEALKLLRPSIPATINIMLRIDPSCRNIHADPSKIHQLIVNICTNAYQAMETSGGVLGIELNEIIPDSSLMNRYSDLQDQPYAKLTISDTGHGMDKMTLNHIFDPFFTTKPVNKGTGLGLSVVHGIITEYQGVIDVESMPGKGCTFHIYLPVSNDTISEVKQAVVAPNRTASILLVDDELATTNFMTRLLGEQGYRIRAFNAPSRALEHFRQSPEAFDLVITDLTMPEMTGVSLVFEIHAIRPEIPVIMMTGYGKDIDNVENLGRQGIRHLLTKPVKLATLVSAINNVVSSI